MSDRTAPALERIDVLLPYLRGLPASGGARLVEEGEALRRAIAAFHMEAIRFRMHAVDRRLREHGDAEGRRLFDDLRQALEEAGFHTRSHAAP